MREPLELYDYGQLRRTGVATMFVVSPSVATLVLGGSQSLDVVDRAVIGETPLRRRRGGGGVVLLHPDDLWIDWWIPADDRRWSDDVHVSALRVGGWWRDVLSRAVEGEVTVHTGRLEGDPSYRVVCFAGRGPGEVFVDGRKAVGVTQWRVREGTFVSTVVHAHSSLDALRYLAAPPEDIESALDHHVTSTLGIVESDETVERLRVASGPWDLRRLLLSA